MRNWYIEVEHLLKDLIQPFNAKIPPFTNRQPTSTRAYSQLAGEESESFGGSHKRDGDWVGLNLQKFKPLKIKVGSNGCLPYASCKGIV